MITLVAFLSLFFMSRSQGVEIPTAYLLTTGIVCFFIELAIYAMFVDLPNDLK